MFENSHTEQSRKREAALPDRPLLDFVDYVFAVCGLDNSVFDDATRDDVFLASVAGYASANVHPLGYAAYYFFSHRRSGSPISNEMQAVDYVRLASYRRELPADDPRCLSVSVDRWKAAFPDLFPEIRFADPKNAGLRERVADAMASFAPEHPLRLETINFARSADRSAYVDYWIARAEAQISEPFKDLRLLAGLHAMSEGFLSFHGMMENVYGKDYELVWGPKRYALFRDLDPDLTALVVGRLAAEIADGRRPVPPGLRSQFPDFYDAYYPETFGVRE